MAFADSVYMNASRAFGKLKSTISYAMSAPLVKESLSYAKTVTAGGRSGITGTSLKSVGMYAAGGAAAGVAQDYAFNNGNDWAAAGLKGAALGGLGRYAYGAGRGAWNQGRSGAGGMRNSWGAGFERMGAAAKYNAGIADTMVPSSFRRPLFKNLVGL